MIPCSWCADTGVLDWLGEPDVTCECEIGHELLWWSVRWFWADLKSRKLFRVFEYRETVRA
jgi:hypothetical protein